MTLDFVVARGIGEPVPDGTRPESRRRLGSPKAELGSTGKVGVPKHALPLDLPTDVRVCMRFATSSSSIAHNVCKWHLL